METVVEKDEEGERGGEGGFWKTKEHLPVGGGGGNGDVRIQGLARAERKTPWPLSIVLWCQGVLLERRKENVENPEQRISPFEK